MTATIELELDEARQHAPHPVELEMAANEPSGPSPAPVVQGGLARPHVRAFTVAADAATGVSRYGTYPSHLPSQDRALDAWPSSVAQGWAYCEFAIANAKRFGVRYLMWQHQTWHINDPVWRWVEERGTDTANHMDHVHTAFEEDAPARPSGGFMADLTEDEQRELLDHLRYIRPLVGDIATAWAEWKKGVLPSPRIDQIDDHLAAVSADVAQIQSLQVAGDATYYAELDPTPDTGGEDSRSIEAGARHAAELQRKAAG